MTSLGPEARDIALNVTIETYRGVFILGHYNRKSQRSGFVVFRPRKINLCVLGYMDLELNSLVKVLSLF